jgi:hypothetical protein
MTRAEVRVGMPVRITGGVAMGCIGTVRSVSPEEQEGRPPVYRFPVEVDIPAYRSVGPWRMAWDGIAEVKP